MKHVSLAVIGCGVLGLLAGVGSCGPEKNQQTSEDLRLTLLAPSGSHADESRLSSFRGEFVVLEFWGTYCAPCIAAIPHWNELVDKFDGRDIRFISVSDEDRETVERFIRRRPIKGTIALDTDRSVFKQYGIWAVPTTVILDRQGEAIAVTDPASLTEEVLNDILQGSPIDLPDQSTQDRVAHGPPSEDEKLESEPLFEIRIAPRARENYKSTNTGDTWWKVEGWSLRESIAFACNVDPNRVEVPDALTETYIDFRIRVPDHMGDALHNALRDALAMTFSVSIERRTPEVDVYVMTLPEGRGPALLETAATGGSRYMSMISAQTSETGSIGAVNQTMQQIARQFESVLGAPVLDETGLEGRFDFDLEYDNSPLGIIPVVREQLGLELSLTRRSIETVVVLPQPTRSAEAHP